MSPARRRLFIVGIAVGVGVVTFLFLVLAPIPRTFSMHDAAIYDLQSSCSGIDTSPGTVVSFHWSSPSSTIFFVVSCSASQIAYEGNGTQGTGWFHSVGGIYEFGSSCPEGTCAAADVSGSFTGPLFPL
jgi:hypothetical protein